MSTTELIIILLSILLLSFFLTYVVRLLALKKSIIDIPNERSSHTIPTPRGGGLAFVFVWYLFITISYFFLHAIEKNLYFALLSSSIIALVGFIDDIKGLSPRIRLISQVFASILGLYLLGGLQKLDLGFIDIDMPVWVNILVFISMLWSINLFNFMDGIDGYLGMEGVFIFISLFIFSGDFNTLAFALAVLGFLIWNWPKAKIFCGDIGSTVIGYTFMIYAIQLQNTAKLSLLIPLILSGLFWFDATLTLYRRFRNGEQLSVAHKKHAYQRLTQSGYSHKQVVLMGIFINLLLLGISFVGKTNAYIVLLAYITHIVVLLGYVRYADRKMKFT